MLLRLFRRRAPSPPSPRSALAFDVGLGAPTARYEVIGDVAVPVGQVLTVWDPDSQVRLSFKLDKIIAQDGEPPLAHFRAMRWREPPAPAEARTSDGYRSPL
jgi:hypothetical protein